jgi:hypothetical protein
MVEEDLMDHARTTLPNTGGFAYFAGIKIHIQSMSTLLMFRVTSVRLFPLYLVSSWRDSRK